MFTVRGRKLTKGSFHCLIDNCFLGYFPFLVVNPRLKGAKNLKKGYLKNGQRFFYEIARDRKKEIINSTCSLDI
jgi:hypothetical protein